MEEPQVNEVEKLMEDVKIEPATKTPSDDVKSWLTWCRNHKNTKCIESDVPEFILPGGYEGKLTDVKVFGKRWGPDDAIYNKHKDLREKVARGNCVLELVHAGNVMYDFVVFALKKFTGGMGDEDDGDTEDDFMWQKYFLKPVSEASSVVCTRKANGEAAHFAVRVIAGKTFIIAGSKNVHLIFGSKNDIDKYTDSRYQVARTVAHTVVDCLMELEKKKRKKLFQFLNKTHYTGVAELLQPAYQHVEDLSYLEKPELRFVAWTTYAHTNTASLCALPPQEGIEKARSFGLKTVDSESIPATEAEERMSHIRRQYGFEGEVLYFMDDSSNVIGLVKKKTAWYVLCRAVREKGCYAVSMFDKGKSVSEDDRVTKTKKRVREIQRWLEMPEDFTQRWTILSVSFVRWLMSRKRRGKLTGDARSIFPLLWKEHLHEKGLVDTIPWND